MRAGEMRVGDTRGGEIRDGDERGGEMREVAGDGEGAFEGCDTAATSLAAVGASGAGPDRAVGTELVTDGGETDDRV